VGLSRAGLGIATTATIAAMWQTGTALPETFGGTQPVLFYDASTRTLYLDLDGGESGNASALFTVQEGGTLTQTDFLFV
jgi:hypothetical protein